MKGFGLFNFGNVNVAVYEFNRNYFDIIDFPLDLTSMPKQQEYESKVLILIQNIVIQLDKPINFWD